MHLTSRVCILAVLLVSALSSEVFAEQARTKWVGRTRSDGEVTVIEDKTASLVIGDGLTSKYSASADLRLSLTGQPSGVLFFPNDPYDGTTGGFYRMNFSRSKGGISLVGRRADWNPQTKRWEPIKDVVTIECQPDPDAKGIKPTLKDMERDGVKAEDGGAAWR